MSVRAVLAAGCVGALVTGTRRLITRVRALVTRVWALITRVWRLVTSVRIRRRSSVWSQRRATLVTVLRAVEVFSFAPVASNHRQALSKASHSSAKRRPHAITSPHARVANAFSVDLLFYRSDTQGWNNPGLKVVNAVGVLRRELLTRSGFLTLILIVHSRCKPFRNCALPSALVGCP